MPVRSSKRWHLRGGPEYDIEKDIQALRQKPESERAKPHIMPREEWLKRREEEQRLYGEP